MFLLFKISHSLLCFRKYATQNRGETSFYQMVTWCVEKLLQTTWAIAKFTNPFGKIKPEVVDMIFTPNKEIKIWHYGFSTIMGLPHGTHRNQFGLSKNYKTRRSDGIRDSFYRRQRGFDFICTQGEQAHKFRQRFIHKT